MKKLDTNCKNTWCPGCGDFGIMMAFKKAIEELKMDYDNLVIVSGIGCHAKIVDYLNLNSFYCLHGRAVTTAEGIKLGNPKLKVVVFTGDGDSLDEGISHLIHAAKRNSDITVILHNNRLFALTTGQFTATSPRGFKGRSTPLGSPEDPINPLELMLTSNASFIARGFAGKIDHLSGLMKQAIEHKGFSFLEVMQPCVSFFNTFDFYTKNSYLIEENDLDNRDKALAKIKKWNYTEDGKVPLGVFYNTAKDPFYEQIKDRKPVKTVKQALKEFI